MEAQILTRWNDHTVVAVILSSDLLPIAGSSASCGTRGPRLQAHPAATGAQKNRIERGLITPPITGWFAAGTYSVENETPEWFLPSRSSPRSSEVNASCALPPLASSSGCPSLWEARALNSALVRASRMLIKLVYPRTRGPTTTGTGSHSA